MIICGCTRVCVPVSVCGAAMFLKCVKLLFAAGKFNRHGGVHISTETKISPKRDNKNSAQRRTKPAWQIMEKKKTSCKNWPLQAKHVADPQSMLHRLTALLVDCTSARSNAQRAALTHSCVARNACCIKETEISRNTHSILVMSFYHTCKGKCLPLTQLHADM